MRIANEFTVNAPIDRAWDVLTDLEQVVPLLPGAQHAGWEGENFLGRMKVKVGPVTSEFSGKANFVERDDEKHRAVISGSGKDSRGSGNAAATITTELREEGAKTLVTVDTDLKIVGKLAQFGSGALQQVSEKLLGQFVQNLEARLATHEETSAETASPEPGPIRLVQQTSDEDALDLVDLLAPTMLRRYGPTIAALVMGLLVVIVLRRKR